MAHPIAGERRRGPFLRLFLLAAIAAGLFLAVAGWPWIGAQARAVVVLSSILQTPVLAPAADAVTGEPRAEDTRVAGNPTTVVRPRGDGPWPALFFVNGATPEGRKNPEVRRLAEGLARAGYLVVVPDLPGLRDDEITPETARETVDVARAVADRPDARGRRVGLIGVSIGASLALIAAKNPELEGRVPVVAGIAPYTDIRSVLSIATTGHYREDGRLVRYEAGPFLSYVVARSLIAGLPPGEDREALLALAGPEERLSPDPLAGFRGLRLDRLDPRARSVAGFLANRDPARFEDLYAALPGRIRADMEKLSPLAGSGRLEMPVEIVSAPRDKYFPVSESYELARIAPDLRVTVTAALDHADVRPSLSDLPDLARLDGFVVRSLREARR